MPNYTNTPADFAELMPHRITVKAATNRDDYGYALTGATTRIHACLLDEHFAVSYAQSGSSPTIQRMAYLNPYPVLSEGADGPVFDTTVNPVLTTDLITLPDGSDHRITNINDNYDEQDTLFVQLITYL